MAGSQKNGRGESEAAYTVVARRYRPQSFEDVVGQDHVVQALRNAIRSGRVTHAYLFSGTRGVGKTSIARIFAKCLNCEKGPTETPCQTCDICRAISIGQDIDVIEIDGASNNGVEAVRELRQNAGLRPSRARTKIYYIDEVHMLSTAAFNALLKTLEEPPEHVKFLFATTEPNKIPITVLSRCQRYEFAGISPGQISDTLADICKKEGVAAESEALAAIARRASGSLRDAESLLEQLLSSEGKKLTVESVHRALGLAPDERLFDLLEALSSHDTAKALRVLDDAGAQGVQPADVLGGMLDVLRDAMVVSAGADVHLLGTPPSQRPRLDAVARHWPLDSILAALQIAAEAKARLRGSPHGRLIVELALARIARLEDFAELSELIQQLSGGGADGVSKKKLNAEVSRNAPAISPSANAKTSAPEPPSPATSAGPRPLTLDAALAVWDEIKSSEPNERTSNLRKLKPVDVEPPGVLVLGADAEYNWVLDRCDTAEERLKLEAILRPLFENLRGIKFNRPNKDQTSESGVEPTARTRPNAAKANEFAGDPLVQSVLGLFDAKLVKWEAEE